MRWALIGLLASCAEPAYDLHITPLVPRTDDTLHAVIRGPKDAEVRWLRDGEPVPDLTADVPGERTTRGELWRAELVHDGVVRTTAAVRIANSAPALTVALPPDARRGEDLRASVTPADPDDEPLTLAWRWFRDGERVPDLTTFEVPGARLHEHEVWSVVVEARDRDGATVRARSEPLTVTRPGSELLREDAVRDVVIRLSDAAELGLRLDPTAWQRADLHVDGLRLRDVGVRLKGRASFEPIDGRPALLIDTDRYVAGQRIDGLDQLALHNMVADPTLVHERAAYAVIRAAGVPAPRTATANLKLAGEPRGAYTLVEVVDGRFLDHWFGDGSGPLYEMVGTELDAAGVDRLDHDAGPDDRAVLHELAAVLADPDASLSGDAAHLIDVPALAAYLAACGVVAHYDGYPYNSPGDDLYLYVDPTDGRVRFAAHGADEALMDPWRPVDYAPGVLAQRCFAELPCRDAFIRANWQIVDTTLAMARDDAFGQMMRQAAEIADLGPPLPFNAEARAAAQASLADLFLTRRDALEQMMIFRLGGRP